ncbi:DeoR/GlpR family DNA-binding transcription regulator [Corynebacterium sp. ES2715-CONJ3]|uniref:DeoR/GlpR family DNA-binding transcription regulator n=1 Tax=Corynebacterium sp. ES2715-CONJ3 TaxID=2974028 RepID=UPI0021692996|nr:DeoR/GlpR family DNA-binding transcription regulator [Corynebacterium sp. ES2715-CONJ3]MCS4490987.1 DeoR/GlpR family DNA-binding transcription regulator [Corynebacterium sp. ES2715-CONJ3]
MYSEERRRQIASLTAVEGRVNVTELAARFNVTAETIRRDLAVLDREGVVHRVHEGAVANQTFQTTEYPLDTRARSASGAKNSIAQAAVRFLPPSQGGIFLDAGTTTAALADIIALQPQAKQWAIVTNSLSIALNLANSGLDEIQLLGGSVRSITQAVVGDTALRTLALLRAEVAFIGTNALTLDHGLSTADAQEAAIKSAMITNARKIVVLCDSTKMGTDYLVSFGSIADIDVIITDSNAPESFVKALKENNIEVVIAD